MSGVAACGVWWMAGWCGQLGPGCHGWRASLRIWSRQSADGPAAGAVGFCLLFSAAVCGAVLVSGSAARGLAAAGDWLRGLRDGHRAASPPESASGSSALADAAAGGSRGPAVPAEPCAAGCVPPGCAAAGPARSGSRRGGADGHAGCGALSAGWAVAAGRLGLAVPSASGAVVPDPGACRVSWAAGWAGRLPSHRVRRRGSSWRASWRSLSGTLVVAVGVRGAGGDDQPPGGDVVAVLLPQPGPGRVERGGLLGQLPCPVQVSRLVRLVGRHRRAVGLHAATVAGLGRGRLPGILLALRGDVVRAIGGSPGVPYPLPPRPAGLRLADGCRRCRSPGRLSRHDPVAAAPCGRVPRRFPGPAGWRR